MKTFEELRLRESHTLAKAAASNAAKSGGKNLTVRSHGNDHFITHKDDPDGENGWVRIKHHSGKFHVDHEIGSSGMGSHGKKSFNNHNDAAKHASKLAKGNHD